jgi:hypothetical protein
MLLRLYPRRADTNTVMNERETIHIVVEDARSYYAGEMISGLLKAAFYFTVWPLALVRPVISHIASQSSAPTGRIRVLCVAGALAINVLWLCCIYGMMLSANCQHDPTYSYCPREPATSHRSPAH